MRLGFKKVIGNKYLNLAKDATRFIQESAPQLEDVADSFVQKNYPKFEKEKLKSVIDVGLYSVVFKAKKWIKVTSCFNFKPLPRRLDVTTDDIISQPSFKDRFINFLGYRKVVSEQSTKLIQNYKEIKIKKLSKEQFEDLLTKASDAFSKQYVKNRLKVLNDFNLQESGKTLNVRGIAT